MNRMLNKLRSGRGASITFALLLFLVCAMVSSVVLAAATTAAGRIAGIAETDQRYYAVTSACELLKDKIDGKAASIVEVKQGDDTTTYLFDKAAYEVVDKDLDNSNEYNSSSGFDSITKCAVYKYSHSQQSNETFTIKYGYTLNSPAIMNALELTTDKDSDPIAVSIDQELDEAGNLVLTVSDAPDKKYVQRMVFGGTVTNDNLTSLFNIDDSARTVKGTTIKWTLTEVDNNREAL